MISKVLQAYRSVPSELWNWTTIAGLADCCCCCLEFFEQDSAQPGLPQSIQFALEGIAIVFKLSTRIRSLQNNKRTVIIKALDRLSFCAGRLPNVNRIDTAGFRRAVLLLGLGRDVARVLRLEKVTKCVQLRHMDPPGLCSRPRRRHRRAGLPVLLCLGAKEESQTGGHCRYTPGDPSPGASARSPAE